MGYPFLVSNTSPLLGTFCTNELFACSNGFSAGINPDDFRGPGHASGFDPLWTDLLEKHAERPYHALVGGGDQIYCDAYVELMLLYTTLTYHCFNQG